VVSDPDKVRSCVVLTWYEHHLRITVRLFASALLLRCIRDRGEDGFMQIPGRQGAGKGEDVVVFGVLGEG
jgi:hypothetical protein